MTLLHQLRVFVVVGDTVERLTHDGDQHVQKDHLGEQGCKDEVDEVQDGTRVFRVGGQVELSKADQVLRTLLKILYLNNI